MKPLIEKIILLAAALPLTVSIGNLFFLRPPPASTRARRISVLIPARNEAATIRGAIEAILASRNVELELIVLDDHSTDGTGNIVREYTDTRVKIIASRPLPANWCGKNHACSQLAEAARYDILLFLDADVRIRADGIARLAEKLCSSPTLGMISGVPQQITIKWLEWSLIPIIHVLLMGYLPLFLDRGARTAFTAACGQLIMVDAKAYHAVGGHETIRNRLHDGMALAKAFRHCGHRTALIDATPISICRMYRRNHEVWSGFRKNATEGLATPVGLPIWTALLATAHIVPFVCGSSPTLWLARLASLAFRALLAVKFRQNWRSVLLSPLGVALLLILQWQSFIAQKLGYPTQWRGRIYQGNHTT
ncbi:glycosyltransferase family 2 protein [Kozakia baliensis]|uniref:glycosyltransferase n=1 Tax=Kozakia baliensis TaxID=153496 RepID=UPI00345B8288